MTALIQWAVGRLCIGYEFAGMGEPTPGPPSPPPTTPSWIRPVSL